MSQSPRTTDVEGQSASNSAAAQVDATQPSPDEHEQQEMSRGPDDLGDHGLGGYDFEVKEQDRWLPIANGKSNLFFFLVGQRATMVRACWVCAPLALPAAC